MAKKSNNNRPAQYNLMCEHRWLEVTRDDVLNPLMQCQGLCKTTWWVHNGPAPDVIIGKYILDPP